jgi:hypothetical protein
MATVAHQREAIPSATTLRADVHLDQRLKGLLWYSLYDVTFDGTWTYVHDGPEAGQVEIGFQFPAADAVYDDFQFAVNGRDDARAVRPDRGKVVTRVDVAAGDTVRLHVHYKTRGQGRWAYQPAVSGGVASLQNFTLMLGCDFTEIDYPTGGMSPSDRKRTSDGWLLSWSFRQVLTGQSLGLVMPSRIQPGELATTLTASAPISLLLFFVVLFVLSIRYRLDIHPLNYLAIAGAFFAFHLLFVYSVDHLSVGKAFLLASAASIALVVSYLRLVVSPRFAFGRAALVQLVYQVGFSLAHFWDGYTGLTVSVLATLTLFLIMQLTGRTRWSEVLSRKRAPAPIPVPAAPSPSPPPSRSPPLPLPMPPG